MSINDWIAIAPALAALAMGVIGGVVTFWQPETGWGKALCLAPLLLLTLLAGGATILNQRLLAEQDERRRLLDEHRTRTMEYMRGQIYVLIKHSSHKAEARQLWIASRRLERAVKSSDPTEIARLGLELQAMKDSFAAVQEQAAWRKLSDQQRATLVSTLESLPGHKILMIAASGCVECQDLMTSLLGAVNDGRWHARGGANMFGRTATGLWITHGERQDQFEMAQYVGAALEAAGLGKVKYGDPQPAYEGEMQLFVGVKPMPVD